MAQILIICGPTATGKTAFGIEMAKKLNGEIVSADSRQVYMGRDLVTGKDVQGIPAESEIEWRNKKLKYYLIEDIKVWLYDIIDQGEEFSVSFWRECADLVIKDILSRGKLPIVVGGSGLYIKSLVQPFQNISIPPNIDLRRHLESKSVEELFNYLKSLDSAKADSLNTSDRKNPHRLIRAIEVALSTSPPTPLHNYGEGNKRGEVLQICLSAPTSYLYSRIDQRVDARITAGAAQEDVALAADPQKWKFYEHGLARRQITWFKKQPNIHEFDISSPAWQIGATDLIQSWYNKN